MVLEGSKSGSAPTSSNMLVQRHTAHLQWGGTQWREKQTESQESWWSSVSPHLTAPLILTHTEDNKSLLLKLIEFLPFTRGILINIIAFINWATTQAKSRSNQSRMVSLQPSAWCHGKSNFWYSRCWLVGGQIGPFFTFWSWLWKLPLPSDFAKKKRGEDLAQNQDPQPSIGCIAGWITSLLCDRGKSFSPYLQVPHQ